MENLGLIKKINSLTFNFENIEMNSVDEVELTIDLGELIMLNTANETFDDLLKKKNTNTGNLFILSRIRLMLHENGIFTLINTYNGTIDKSYLTRMNILLNKAGFIDIKTKNHIGSIKIKSIRRPLISKKLGYGMTFKEVLDPWEISRCHQFTKDYYYYKDFNYDLDVVKQFDLNCDHYTVYDEDNEICSIARVITRTPGFCCPFMYATLFGDKSGRHMTIPGKDARIGEVMAIYSAGRKGVVAFKLLMEYGATIMNFDSLWTTYDEDDEYTGTYYKKKFMMDDTGIKLTYSDFGGAWNLLVGSRLEELKNLNDQIFMHK